MSDLLELYQELILDHNRRPRNRGTLPGPHGRAEGYNPLCGDRVTITLRLEHGRIADLRFDGAGCAISTASASLMSEAVKGRTPEEAKTLLDRFLALVTGTPAPSPPPGAPDPGDLGKLEAFSGVSRFPARVKCATLAWHTLAAALDEDSAVVTTE